MVLPTIVRKQLGETRWSLFFTFAGYFAFTFLHNWIIAQYQHPRAEEPEPAVAATESDAAADLVEEAGDRKLDMLAAQSEAREGSAPGAREKAAPDPGEDEGRRRRRRRDEPPPAQFYMFFGVPAERMMDPANPPTLLMQTTLCNHPLVWMALMGWAIARGAASVAGEIERGTLDQTLSRPVYRSTYLSAQIVTTILTFLVLALALAAGHLVSSRLYDLHEPPGPLGYFPSTVMILALGLAIYGYTLVFSSVDLVRVRVGIIGAALTVGGLAAIVSTQNYPNWKWLQELSVFHYYWPVRITDAWDRDQWIRLGKLFGTFGVGAGLSYFFFLRRDLPTSAG